MKKYFLFLFFFSIVGSLVVSAQESTAKFTFIEKLVATPKAGEGQVKISQDPRLVSVIAERAKENKKKNDTDFVATAGYRVQIYSSNAPRVSKDEAFRMESQMKERLPEFETYVSFASPFWKVRVGDCVSQQEAAALLDLLRKEFPQQKDTFYVVKDEIKIYIK